jgi:hypothetical protein
MSNAVQRRKFSASTDGMPILIAATATAGTLVHTAYATIVEGSYDEIWLYLVNNSAADVMCTVEFGDASTANNIIYTVLAKDGLKCVVCGLGLQNAKTVKVFAAVPNVISAHGHVNRIN